MKPILTAHLLPVVEAHLLELLRSLRPDEWALQTIAPAWKVKDVAAHLLDTQLRKLSRVRDDCVLGPRPQFSSHDEFLAFINRLNAEGVEIPFPQRVMHAPPPPPDAAEPPAAVVTEPPSAEGR